MKAILVRTTAYTFVVMLLGISLAPAQFPSSAPSDQATQQFSAQQLDQMLAPIALYPDSLLAQVLMAATYPLEVVEADRWLDDQSNTTLKGDQLEAALEQQSWDPSVKSLVPFPQILHMMDGKLDWTERLGDAFLASQSDVMDSVQRLRQRAEAAGKLRTTPQQVVADQDQIVTIEPSNPEIVYVPVYDPTVVYGAWPYPSFMPYYFPDYFDGVIIDGFGFGWFGIGIVGPLWGWDHWDWGRHRIDIDEGRFGTLNRNHPSIGGGAWEHDPFHRRGVPYRDSATRERFPAASGSPDERRNLRGYPAGPTEQFRSTPGVGQSRTPQAITPPPAQRVPPTFESFGRGADVRSQAERGYNSRMSAPNFPSGNGATRSAPSFGGGGMHSAPAGGGSRGHR